MIGAASVGFLVWNWPPAKIFMGDVGSGYLGFSLAVLGVASSQHDPSAPLSWLIVAGIFAVDATFTVARRFLRGERVTQAHRTHAFQLLAKRIGHRNATLGVASVNLVWILPCAIASILWPQYISELTALTLSPLIAYAFMIGAGQPEAPPRTPADAPSAIVVPLPKLAMARRRMPANRESFRRPVPSHAQPEPILTERRPNDVECAN